MQLYNPDQQVVVKWHSGSWGSAPYWGFEMPQQSFRQPSTSTLDRTQSDPTASENTPQLGFRWKKDGKLSKDYVCSLSGKSTNPDGSKRKHREPDITVALFKHFKEITIYQPNLSRIEMEDPKGLEVVLLLGAIVIREVYNSSMHETFNITDTVPNASVLPSSPVMERPHGHRKSSAPNSQPPPRQSSDSRPPPTDPRSQWELDLETVRLQKQVEQEDRQRRRADAAETKRVKKMLEEEDRRRRERQKEIDRETERLKKMYGKEQRQSLQQYPSLQAPQGQPVTAYPPAPVQRPHSTTSTPYIAHNLRHPQQQSPYLQAPGPAAASSSGFFGGGGAPPRPIVPKKSSFWHIGKKEDNASRLTKQRSTVF